MDGNMVQTGDVLGGRYQIVTGGTAWDIGTFYKAYDAHRQELVALLLLDERFKGDADSPRRVIEKQQAVADLASPALLPTTDVGVSGDRMYLVHELVEGYPLADLLIESGALGVDAALQMTLDLCDALAPLHREGMVHGSLSPYSVLLDDDGQMHITEVGLFPALHASAAGAGLPRGRTPYLSPEQAAGEVVHPATDVYLIGCLLYHMLTGRPPFYGKDEAVLALRHRGQEPPALQVLAPDVPEPLARIVHEALAKEPAARYRNAGQLAHILRAQLGAGETASPLPARERLLVPAPPLAAYDNPIVEWQDGAEEPQEVDWLLVALVVAALIAVLGLIPLWRTVYQRYAAPPPAGYQSQNRSQALAWTTGLAARGEAAGGVAVPRAFETQVAVSRPLPAGCETRPKGWKSSLKARAGAKLDNFGLVWYNLPISKRL